MRIAVVVLAAAATPACAGPPPMHAVPAGLTCDTAKASATSVTLHWAAVSGADLYDLQCAGSGSAVFTKPFVS